MALIKRQQLSGEANNDWNIIYCSENILFIPSFSTRISFGRSIRSRRTFAGNVDQQRHPLGCRSFPCSLNFFFFKMQRRTHRGCSWLLSLSLDIYRRKWFSLVVNSRWKEPREASSPMWAWTMTNLIRLKSQVIATYIEPWLLQWERDLLRLFRMSRQNQNRTSELCKYIVQCRRLGRWNRIDKERGKTEISFLSERNARRLTLPRGTIT